jgi:hypothetical protein
MTKLLRGNSDEVDMPDPGDDQDLIQAQGLALALVGSLLERDAAVPRGEFSRYLAVLADVTRETSDRQAEILSAWAELALKASAANQR